MKLAFVSNYFNHHQKPLAEEFRKIYGADYAFIAFTPFNKKRLAIGYHDMNQEPFVIRAYENDAANIEARRIIDEAECVISAGMPVSCVNSRLKLGKLTFMQSERFFKGPVLKDIARFVKYLRYSGGRFSARDISAKFFLLSAGKFAAKDYNFCGLFRGKSYKWGYFPEVKRYDVDALISRKDAGRILWAGRFLDWKHPDLAVKLAKNLREAGAKFHLKIIGSGEMEETLSRMIDTFNLRSCVEISGALPFEELRSEMERAEIFLFTSDREEGWGVVQGEAMNSGCAVVSGDKIGSASYLVKANHNGIIFADKNIHDLTKKVLALLSERGREKISELGRNAYETVAGVWSAETAAKRFVRLAEVLKSEKSAELFSDGPCSAAGVMG